MRCAPVPLLLVFLAACAGSPEAWHRAAGDGTAAPPASGGALHATLASLFEAPGKGHRLEVVELRVLAAHELPWTALEAGRGDASRGRVGVTAHRVCRHREGLTFTRTERSSWMIFEDDRLLAWDHGTFDSGCETGRSYRPARPEHLDLERGLLRYAAQRYPAARPSLEERLRGGLALLEVDRLEDAERLLRQAKRNVGELADYAESVFGDEREAAEERLVVVRALHTKLRRAVRDAKRSAEAAR